MRVLRAIVLPSRRVLFQRLTAIAIGVLVSGSLLSPAEANDLNQRRGGWYTGWGFGPFEMRLVQLVAPIWGSTPEMLRGPQIKKSTPDDAVAAALRGGAS